MTPLEPLIAAARNGDEAAYEALVDRFRDMAYHKAYAVLGDHHLAQDAVQEAFLEAFASLDKLRQPAAFPGWFRRIVIKRIDRLIRNKSLPLASLDAGLDVAAEFGAPGQELDRLEVGEALRSAVEDLPKHERGLAKAYYFDEAPQKEIAIQFNLPVTTVKKRLYTSRQRLKETLADFEEAGFGTEASANLVASAQLFAAARNGFTTKADLLLRDDPSLARFVNGDGLSILLYAAHSSHYTNNRAVADLLVVRRSA